jgi:flavin reductase (DIM6/NTAB) family NADH-FMN oxidoreductase RutF
MNVAVSTIVKDMHFYEPGKGHGLAHDPLTAIVAPRPIGWVASVGAKGNVNVAPYSFFNIFNYKPPILAFSSNGWKDTVQNIQETGEFTWNLVTMPIAKQMNITSASVPRDVSEFTTSGLTPVASKFVKVPRVGEARCAMELKLIEVKQLQTKEGDKLQCWMVFGEVVAIYIDKTLIVDGVYQTTLAHPISRGGRRGDYFEISPATMFEMPRPDDT